MMIVNLASIIIFDTFARYKYRYSPSANVCLLCLSSSLKVHKCGELGAGMLAQYK